MAMTYLTKLKPEPMGAHSLSTAYGVNSLVMSGDGAAAYISVKDVPAGTPLTNTEYWKIHTDLTAVKQSAEAAAQKANAARDEMLEIARSLTDMVEKSGNPVQAELVGGLPFDRVETVLAPIQSGSGDPSPSNIRTISGWTGAKLTRCGKNLMPRLKEYDDNGVKLTANADGSYTLNGTCSVAAGNPLIIGATSANIILNGTYTLSAGNTVVDTSIQIRLDGGVFNMPLFEANYKQTKTFDNTSVSSIAIRIEGGKTYDNVKLKLQLELGSIATTYEPYAGDDYAASFGQTVYGGTLDWNTGVLNVEWAIHSFTGAEDINHSTSGNEKFTYYGLMNVIMEHSDGASVAPIACSHFKNVSADILFATDSGYSVAQSGQGLWFHKHGFADLDEFKAYLAAQYAAGTPVQVCYRLATPTTIQLTPQEIKQLQGANTLYGDGSISMTGRADKALALEARIAALEAAG